MKFWSYVILASAFAIGCSQAPDATEAVSSEVVLNSVEPGSTQVTLSVPGMT